MNLVVLIDGREAIPVRAIPLLTDWKVMWPDVVAKALAGNEFYFDFDGLCAYRIEGGATKLIKATWWQEFAVRDLKALSDRIKADQVTHDAGHQKWRKESLAELPAGVFVWKDEYVPMYEWRYGPDALARSLGREITQSERQARELDFDPFISAEYAALVKQNFEHQQTAPVEAAPVVQAPASEARRRYQMCIDAGLAMPDNDYATLPIGINLLAQKEGITKQAFSKSVKKHLATRSK